LFGGVAFAEILGVPVLIHR